MSLNNCPSTVGLILIIQKLKLKQKQQFNDTKKYKTIKWRHKYNRNTNIFQCGDKNSRSNDKTNRNLLWSFKKQKIRALIYEEKLEIGIG